MEGASLPESRSDRLISLARILLAAFTLLAIWLDPQLGRGTTQIVVTVVGATFAAYAILLAVISRRVIFSDRTRLLLHVTDFLLYSALIGVTQAPVVFLVFWIFCGLLRFGTRGAALSAITAVVTLAALTLTFASFRSAPAAIVLRLASLVTMSLLVVSFGAYERRVRSELSRIASWPQSHAAGRMAIVEETLRSATSLLGATSAGLFWEESEEPWVWIASVVDDVFTLTREGPNVATAIVAADAEQSSFICDWRRSDNAIIDSGRGPRPGYASLVFPAARERFALHSAAVSSPVKGDLVDGRVIFGIDRAITIDDLPLSEIVARLIAARIDYAAAAERMRDSAVGEERIRVARDLHDGLLQSLTGATLQLESVHRLIDSDAETARARVRNVQQLIETDQRELRSFITQLRPESTLPRSGSLRARLQMLAGRFERQWNVDVTVDVDPPAPVLSESLAAEIYNIVNEATTNAAKHAGGTHINVGVCVGEHGTRIVIEDDGRGFPFHGSYDLARLDEMKRGPITLKERVASLQGDLRLHSTPSGTRLEVTLGIVN